MIIPYLQKKEINWVKIQETLKSSIDLNHFTNNGPVKQELEEYLHSYLRLNSDKVVVAVSSATAGLHLLLMYYEELGGNLKWATPSFTFPSVVVNNPKNINILDIDEKTYTIPFDKNIEKYDGYIITNLFGTYPSNMEEWINYCKEKGKPLIFDNASSPLTRINNKNICNFGDACIISFHPTKYLGSQCEGGAIIVNREEYEKVNSLTNFGFNNSRRYNKYSSNFKLDDLRAAFILNHIKEYDLGKHSYCQNYLTHEISKFKNVKIFNFKDENEVLGNLCLEFDRPIDNRDLLDVGITAHKYYMPLDERHINSVNLYSRILNLPLNSSLSSYQLDFMLKQIERKTNG